MKLDEIKKLVDVIGESNLTHFEIEYPDGVKVVLKKEEQRIVQVPAMNNVHTNVAGPTQTITQTQSAPIKQEPEQKIQTGNIVKSPIVGTFYEATAPGSKPFAAIGQKVKKGDILCIIEAMKLMNEIESEFDGEIAEIYIQNAEMVDFGKPLFRII